MLPGSVNFTVYRQDTFAFAFIFKDTQGDPFDMENLGDVTMRVFVPNREGDPLFSPTLSENGNVITGLFSPEQTILLTARQYYFEMRSTFQGREVTLINGAIEAKDATDGIGVTDAVSDVTIDLASQTIEVTLGDSATIALQAKNDAVAARDVSISEANRSEQEADRSFAEAERAETEADRAEAEADRALQEGQQQVSLATTQAGNALTQANRAEAEADEAQSARLDVQNAVDAFILAYQALNEVAGLKATAQLKGGQLLIAPNEPSVNPPTGFGVFYMQGDSLRIKLSNGTTKQVVS